MVYVVFVGIKLSRLFLTYQSVVDNDETVFKGTLILLTDTIKAISLVPRPTAAFVWALVVYALGVGVADIF